MSVYSEEEFYKKKLSTLLNEVFQGNPDAMVDLGYEYVLDHDLDDDEEISCLEHSPQKARILFQLAANKGSMRGHEALGWIHSQNFHGTFNMDRAAEHFETAATLGSDNAQTSLGWMYMNGDGVGYDSEKGLSLLRDASKQGNVRAQEILRTMHYSPHQTGNGQRHYRLSEPEPSLLD